MTPVLIGLAYTSPSVAVLAIDRQLYRVFVYGPKNSQDYNLFLQQVDNRNNVVMVTTVHELKAILDKDTANLRAIILFSEPTILQAIEGIHILDVDAKRTKKYIAPSILNASLNQEGASVKLENAIQTVYNMTRGITFRELVQVVVDLYAAQERDSTDIVKHMCMFLVGLSNKKTWVSMGRKPAMAAGITVDSLAELEKFIETSKLADTLWRVFHQYTAGDKPLEKIKSDPYDKQDFELICNALGAKQGSQFEFVDPPPELKKSKTKTKKKAI